VSTDFNLQLKRLKIYPASWGLAQWWMIFSLLLDFRAQRTKRRGPLSLKVCSKMIGPLSYQIDIEHHLSVTKEKLMT
jgi:hypothetical protein